MTTPFERLAPLQQLRVLLFLRSAVTAKASVWTNIRHAEAIAREAGLNTDGDTPEDLIANLVAGLDDIYAPVEDAALIRIFNDWLQSEDERP